MELHGAPFPGDIPPGKLSGPYLQYPDCVVTRPTRQRSRRSVPTTDPLLDWTSSGLPSSLLILNLLLLNSLLPPSLNTIIHHQSPSSTEVSLVWSFGLSLSFP